MSTYPLPMQHPDFRPAEAGLSPDLRKGTPGTKGKAAKFPPCVANNQHDEAYLASKGYVPNPKGRLPTMMVEGKIDTGDDDSPSAPADDPVAARLDYPRYVGSVRVEDEQEHRAALEAQGQAPEPEAPTTQAAPAPEPAPQRRAAPTPVPQAPEEAVPTLLRITILEKQVAVLQKNVRNLLDAADEARSATRALPPPQSEPAQPLVVERDHLRRQIKELGIAADKRISTAKMRELVEAAQRDKAA